MKQTTLLFLRKDDHILLAMKKRGFGVDKWNGAGGKVEEGETIPEAAIRECQEEIGVTPNHLILAGEFHFIDLPDVEHYCNIFEVTDWIGDPSESEEMRPQWFHVDEIPYDNMWADDREWMPLLLAGKKFKGKVIINEDGTIQKYDLAEVAEL
jgi:8-oxo-dGTP diphosphatase